MAFLTKKDNLVTVQQTFLYGCGSKMMHMRQGDAQSKRLYKKLSATIDKVQNFSIIDYWHIKWEGSFQKQTYLSRVIRAQGKPEVREYLIVYLDKESHIIAYEDSKGNHWKKEWGVEMPYPFEGIIRYKVRNTTLRIWNTDTERANPVIEYPNPLTQRYSNSSLYMSLFDYRTHKSGGI
jgi:hypothetical protein